MTQESGPGAPDTAERTIALPSGHHVTLADWGSLTRGDKRRVLELCPRRADGDTTGFELATGLLTLLITHWDFDLPLPNMARDALDRLSWADDGVLQQAVDPIRTALFPPLADGDAASGPLAADGTVRTPSDNWITLRDWHELTRGDKRTVFSAIKPSDGTTSGYDLDNGLLTVLVTNWSYDVPLPTRDAGALDQLPWGDDKALRDAVTAAKRALFPPALPSTPEEVRAQEADPTSPTTGAGD